jgi:hypothetical protein
MRILFVEGLRIADVLACQIGRTANSVASLPNMPVKMAVKAAKSSGHVGRLAY